MFALSRPTARLAVVASFAALLAAGCNADSKDVSSLAGPTLSASKNASTPSTPSGPLGVAGDFVILGNQAVTCTDATITGNVGTFLALGSVPPGSVTQTRCSIVGTVHVGDAAAIAAYNAFLAAYIALAPKLTDVCPIITGTLAGTTLAPGTYCVSAEAKTGVLTLNGPATGIWTFKVAPGAFTGTSFQVIMAGGAQACNVTWWTDAATTMTDSDLKGTVLSGAAVTLTRGTLIGRAFAHADATVSGTTVTGCVGGGGSGGGHDDDCDKDHGKRGHHHKNHHDKGHQHDKHHDSRHHDKHHNNHHDKHHDSKHDGSSHHGGAQ